MRLNSVSINANAINTSALKRLRVSLDGEVAIAARVEATGTRRIVWVGSIVGPVSNVAMDSVITRFAGVGSATFSISNDVDLKSSVTRRASGNAIVECATSLYYVKQVYMDGTAIVVIGTDDIIGIERAEGAVLIDSLLTVSLNGLKGTGFDGSVDISIGAEMGGQAKRMASAMAVIEALSFSSGVTNVDREDIVSQVFFKPYIEREFFKPVIAREYFTG